MSALPEHTIILVVDRKTRQVIDCTQASYSWDMDNLIERHDLSKVDMILRQAISTVIPKIVPESEEPIAAGEETEDTQPIAGVGADQANDELEPF